MVPKVFEPLKFDCSHWFEDNLVHLYVSLPYLREKQLCASLGNETLLKRVLLLMERIHSLGFLLELTLFRKFIFLAGLFSKKTSRHCHSPGVGGSVMRKL